MMSYWLDGYNQDFLQLLDRMDRVQFAEKGTDEDVSDFSTSFPNRSSKVWRVVSGPYSKDDEDVGGFIVGEDDESEVDDGVQINPNFTPDKDGGAKFKSPEEQVIEHLKKRNSKGKQFDSSESGSSESESAKGSTSSDGELEVLEPKDRGYSEVESEDEWTKSKYRKTKAKLKEDSDEEVFMEDGVRPVKGRTPKKRVLDDSESDDDPF